MSLSDEQKKNLSAVARGRSRNASGQFVDATTALEARIAGMEQEDRVAQLTARVKELADINEGLALKCRDLKAAKFEGVITTLVVAVFVAVVAFFVGRWAR